MDLVIFDCDGVLIDSEIIACTADARALTEIGYPMTTDEVAARFAGMPSDAMYAEIEADMGRPLPSDFAERVKQQVLKTYRSDLKALDGVSEVLRSLVTPKCVASSSEPAKLALGLIETGLYELLYPHVFSTALVERGKPHPDIFLYAAKAMDASPKDCLVVEDSVAGVTAARAAGMTPIGFTGGSHCGPGHAQRLMEAGAQQVMGDMRSLLDTVS